MHKNQGPVYYGDYLKLNNFLNCQSPKSREYATSENPEAHDETLFIIVHQAYELWFKQILHDLNLVLKCFNQDKIADDQLSSIVQKLDRIRKVQSLFGSHLEILETMTPMDFLEFRNLLIPASGFQSTQFREIEIKLGLGTIDRQSVDREFFLGRLNQADRDRLTNLENSPSLLKLLSGWLERTPYTAQVDFNFWDEYQKAIQIILTEDEQTIQKNLAHLSETEQKSQLENLKTTRLTFASLFNTEAHQKLVSDGQRKLSQKAILNALFVLLYRDEPMLALPHQLLTILMDIDENFTAWRYRHALLAHRMLGSKIGTGGSSGHQYLKRAADNNRVFVDLFNLSTYLIPRSRLPKLPESVKRQLNFVSSQP